MIFGHQSLGHIILDRGQHLLQMMMIQATTGHHHHRRRQGFHPASRSLKDLPSLHVDQIKDAGKSARGAVMTKMKTVVASREDGEVAVVEADAEAYVVASGHFALEAGAV
jgi:hypothetical protein